MPPRSRRPSPLALLAAALLSLAPACSSRDADPAQASPGRSYAVRGEIVALPGPGAAPRQLFVRHEPIRDFADASGKVVGMDSMVMPFDLAPDVSVDGLAVGDAIELRLAVDFSKPVFRIESVKRLPEGTTLRFGKAAR